MTRAEEGFIAGLSGPVLMVFGVVLIALSAWGISHKVRANYWKAQYQAEAEALVMEKAAHAAFVEQTKARGEAARKEAERKEEIQRVQNDALREQARAADARYNAALVELRKRPPVRPDGSAVPVAACRPEGTGEPPSGESVPLADYRALEARALYDAETVALWRAWMAAHNLTVN